MAVQWDVAWTRAPRTCTRSSRGMGTAAAAAMDSTGTSSTCHSGSRVSSSTYSSSRGSSRSRSNSSVTTGIHWSISGVRTRTCKCFWGAAARDHGRSGAWLKGFKCRLGYISDRAAGNAASAACLFTVAYLAIPGEDGRLLSIEPYLASLLTNSLSTCTSAVKGDGNSGRCNMRRLPPAYYCELVQG